MHDASVPLSEDARGGEEIINVGFWLAVIVKDALKGEFRPKPQRA